LTEDGPRPEFAETYGTVELPTDSDPDPTERNVRDADAILWFGATDTPGARCTLEWCRKCSKATVLVSPGGPMLPSHVAEWLRAHPYVRRSTSRATARARPRASAIGSSGSSARSSTSSACGR
jgi:hypothetical protein